jgi:branched-chain amino acid transport system permease protein
VLSVLAITALLLAPFLVDALLGRAWVRVLDLVMLYTMLALGLNIVVGFAGLLDLGYIAFFAVGAYLYALCASPHFGLHLPFWLLLPAAALVAGLFGMLLGAPTLKLRGDYLAIVTLGFGEIIRITAVNSEWLGAAAGGIVGHQSGRGLEGAAIGAGELVMMLLPRSDCL